MGQTKGMLDPATTALILIDLQKGIVANPVGPRPGSEVVGNASRLADRFRSLGSPVFLVRVAFSEDGKDAVRPPAAVTYPSGERPADWADLVPEIGPKQGDFVITKHQWGAFHGTELDLQLRRRGIKTIVLGGISTNFGVESTARNAMELGYAQVFVEDAMAGMSAEAHAFPIANIFPRMGFIRTTDEVLADLADV